MNRPPVCLIDPRRLQAQWDDEAARQRFRDARADMRLAARLAGELVLGVTAIAGFVLSLALVLPS